MKFLVAFVCLVVAAMAVEEPVPIVAYDAGVEHDGTFHYSYESGDGTKAQQEGQLKVFDAEHSGEVAKGSYSYKSPEGEEVSLTYVADENGFQPQGSHLPTPPPIPELIARSLEFAASHPAKP